MRASIVSKCSSKSVLCKCQQEMRRCLPESIMHNPVTSDQTLCPKMAHVCNLFIIHIYTLKISECPLCQTAGYNVSGTEMYNAAKISWIYVLWKICCWSCKLAIKSLQTCLNQGSYIPTVDVPSSTTSWCHYRNWRGQPTSQTSWTPHEPFGDVK